MEKICIGTGVALEGIAIYYGYVRPYHYFKHGMTSQAIASHAFGYVPGALAKVFFGVGGFMYIKDFWSFIRNKKPNQSIPKIPSTPKN